METMNEPVAPVGGRVAIRCEATRWLSDDFPGFLEVVLTDAYGVRHTIHDKAPVFSTDNWSAESVYPATIWVEADIVNSRPGVVSVRLAWFLEDEDGCAVFDVASDTIVDANQA